MLPLSKHIGTGFGKGELYDVLKQLQNMAVPLTQTKVYYVSKGGNNVDGLSWETAFTTIEAAITAQTALVAGLPSAQKNVNSYIIIAPGIYDEKLTTLPYSCTMIGLGIPGTDKATEWHTTSGACISGTVSGLRLINIRFEAGGVFDLLHFVVANNTEIINCDFQANENNKNAISIENSGYLTVRGCKIGTGSLETFECGIYATGFLHNAIIEDNIIDGLDPTGIGIYIDALSTASLTVIRNNIIKLTGTGLGIDDDVNQAIVVGNHIFTIGGSGLDVNEDLASMNVWNNGTKTVLYPKVESSLS